MYRVATLAMPLVGVGEAAEHVGDKLLEGGGRFLASWFLLFKKPLYDVTPLAQEKGLQGKVAGNMVV